MKLNDNPINFGSDTLITHLCSQTAEFIVYLIVGCIDNIWSILNLANLSEVSFRLTLAKVGHLLPI